MADFERDAEAWDYYHELWVSETFPVTITCQGCGRSVTERFIDPADIDRTPPSCRYCYRSQEVPPATNDSEVPF